jgi:hypothetical protein
MNRLLFILLLFVSGLPAQEAEETALTGPALLQRVREQLPPMPLRMKGFVRTRVDGKQTDRALVSELRFGDSIPNASYALSDSFGDPLAFVRVSWPRGRAVLEQWDAEGKILPAPNATDAVADTGLIWSDLSLDFLWWPGAELTGSERVKTRPSHILRIPAPENRNDLRAIRLWIDQKALFVVRAEILGEKDNVLRRIEVDSIKEIREDFWIVKDVIIRDYQNNRRMGLRFEDVEEITE